MGINFNALLDGFEAPAVPATTQLQAETLIATAKHKLRGQTPYFRPMLLSLVLRWTPGFGTIGVSRGHVLSVDPLWLVQFTPSEVAGLLLHEVLHLWQKHAQRLNGRDPMLWNVAGDMSINPGVIEVGLELPKGENTGCFPKDIGMADGLSADEYYRKILEKAQQQQQQGASSGEGDGDSQGKGQGGSGSGKEPHVGAGACGGCSGNGHENEGEADAADGRTEAQTARLARQTSEAVREAATSKQQGKVPAGWARIAEASLEPPKVPWRTKLDRAVRRAVAFRAGASVQRYDAPSRRQGGLGFGVGSPVLARPRQAIPEVAVLVDTSGSMGAKELAETMREARGILKSVGANVTFYICDADVHNVVNTQSIEDVVAALKGGGGTDFHPAFRMIEKARIRPEVFVVLTDGFASVPSAPPRGVHVIWTLLGRHVNEKVADYGDHIRVDAD